MLTLTKISETQTKITLGWTPVPGGDFTEAVTEFSSGTGATATMQLQTASMAAAGTVSGGTATVTSVAWGTIGTALIPAPTATGATFLAAKRRG